MHFLPIPKQESNLVMVYLEMINILVGLMLRFTDTLVKIPALDEPQSFRTTSGQKSNSDIQVALTILILRL